jgi:hypothetical protein
VGGLGPANGGLQSTSRAADNNQKRIAFPSDKGTPTARSVRKAEGLGFETARPPNKANGAKNVLRVPYLS